MAEESKKKRDVEIFDMWLACHTQQEIAKALGVTQGRISQLLLGKEDFRFLIKVDQLREIDPERLETTAASKRSEKPKGRVRVEVAKQANVSERKVRRSVRRRTASRKHVAPFQGTICGKTQNVNTGAAFAAIVVVSRFP